MSLDSYLHRPSELVESKTEKTEDATDEMKNGSLSLDFP
jgi:hypothetical protein